MRTLLLFLSALLVSLLPLSEARIIPDSFIYRNLSQYTIRYLSESGRDTSSCLADQGYPAAVNSTTESCRTLQFALIGSYNDISEDISRLIVLARRGSYTFGATGIKIFRSNHIILSKLPGEEGEVVLSCIEFDEAFYNNLFFNSSSYIALNDVVLTGCGQQSTALGTIAVSEIVISKTTFR